MTRATGYEIPRHPRHSAFWCLHGVVLENCRMNLTTIGTLFGCAVSATIAYSVAWNIQANTITEMELNDALRRNTESHEAFKRLEKDTTQVAAAQSRKVGRDSANLSDAANARSSGNGLRVASADTVRAAQASASACIASLARYGIVLDEVVAAGGAMAGEADGWASDAVMLHESWPK